MSGDLKPDVQVNAYLCHPLSRSLVRDCRDVFPDLGADATASEFVLAPLLFRTQTDLVSWQAEASAEKDQMLESFVALATRLRAGVVSRHPDAWFDAVEPSSGIPLFGDSSNHTWSCLDAISAELPHLCPVSAGECRVIEHPTWRTFVYPTSVLTTCPPGDFADLLERNGVVVLDRPCASSVSIAGDDAGAT